MIVRPDRLAVALCVAMLAALAGCPDATVATDGSDVAPSDVTTPDTRMRDAVTSPDTLPSDASRDVEKSDGGDADGGRSVMRSDWEVTAGDLTRDVHVVRPAPVPANPTVWVFLHGCSQDGPGFAESVGADLLARRRGTVALFPTQDFAANPQRCWRWYDDEQRRPDDSEAALVQKSVERARDELGISPGRVYLAGLSAGGGLAAIVAGCLPDRFDGIAIHSGLAFAAADSAFEAPGVMLDPSQAREPGEAGRLALECGAEGSADTPMVIIHGRDDTTVDPDHAEHTARQFLQTRDLRDDGMDNDSLSWRDSSETQRQISGHTVTVRTFDGTPLKMLMIDGLDHAYAGATGTYGDPDAPDATDYASAFFRSR